ncbi:hypothetical protein KIN20_029478 [Parelaphostrongylus tenuis]|uniref:Uncharacterized protein n=1 Tax=Parelaphostrongylus tenuis TaxID=148309 RepID=A0AAD5R2T9_PARTN|nr:hypothetical protein KIN20_029478 [Parelaphostrongylus tenuis]
MGCNKGNSSKAKNEIGLQPGDDGSDSCAQLPRKYTSASAANEFSYLSLVARSRAASAVDHGEFAPPSSQMQVLECDDCYEEAYAHASTRSCTVHKSPPSMTWLPKKVIWETNRYVGCTTHVCDGFYFTSRMHRAS